MTSTSPPQRLPIDSEESDRKTEVRSVAARLFLQAGYASTTMNDIAEAAGVLPGSLYHHFASKEEIAVELITAFNHELTELTNSTLTSTDIGTPERRLRDLAARSAELGMRHAAAVRLSAFQAPTNATERLAAVMNLETPELIESWRSVVDATVDDAEVPVDSGLLRFALAHLSLDSGTTFPPGTDVRPSIDQACDLFLHGLASIAPADVELDGSVPMGVAVKSVASWSDREPDESDVKTAIIAAARTEFARRGYAETTIRDIADVAQVRMGTLYRRVSSKEAMLTEVLETYSSELSHGLEAVTGAEGTAVEKLDALAFFLIQATRHFHEAAQILKFGWTGVEANGPFQAYARQSRNRLDLLEALVAEGLDSGEFRRIGSPAEIALLIRRVLWLRFQDFEQADFERTQKFIRRSLLHPTLT